MSDQQRDGGAFWWATDRDTGEEKRTKNGDKYMTGKITIGGVTHNATLFYQKNKKSEKHPDISISINQPRSGGSAAPAQARQGGEDEIRVEDIPF